MVTTEEIMKKDLDELENICMDELGMDLDDAFAEYHVASVVPAICFECGSVADKEPDSRDGYCEECGMNKMVSVVEIVITKM